MSHCQSEHNGVGHNHDHDHDHSDDVTPAIQHLLYWHIKFTDVVTLNESSPHLGKAVLEKPWDQRMTVEPELSSDTDEQLLMTVPFAGVVQLHSIILRTSNSQSAPRTLKLYVNKDGLDFEAAADTKPTQVLELPQTPEIQEHPVKRALFRSAQSLTLFFEDNYGYGDEDTTRISYIAFKGIHTELSREPLSIAYEAAANPKDHQVPGVKSNIQHSIE